MANVYTFQNGRATRMRAFANRDDALRWAGIQDSGRYKSGGVPGLFRAGDFR